MQRTNLKSQSGVSFMGFLIFAVLIALGLIVAFKVTPAYIEYFSVKKTLRKCASEGAGLTPKEIKKIYERATAIDSLDAVTTDMLVISDDNGATVVAVEYQKKVPLVGNVSFLFDFSVKEKSGGLK